MPAFLFTDIESSTRLWEEHPDEMRSALARHDEILRRAIEDSNGTPIKATGDGMLAVFVAVRDAVAATLAAQSALHAEEARTRPPIRARMGVHFGDADMRDGDYFGPTLNRTARIMAAGHGGQVLLSEVAADLADGSLPKGAALRDLGSHRLKDLTLPEHIYQLLHPALQSDFPPLVTLESHPNNLPTQVTEFFGRESEIAAVELMLEAPATHLLTLTGPGGAGKTRLGLQVAADLLDDYRDGVFFVDLAPETNPESAYEAIVRALALPASGGGTALDVLKSRLQDRQMLLLLDNFEQVIPAAVGVVELIQRCPGLKVLVTSREALRVRPERVFPVPAMSLPHPTGPAAVIAESEAVRLFAERARAARPDFAIDDHNASTIAEICLRLDGLPLAIELAAARLNVFSPQELLDRIRTRLDVLGAGGRDLPDRQRTLWGAIGWSYELLDPDERTLFEMMSVFSTTRLRDVEAVADAALRQRNVVGSLASLVDKSLIRSRQTAGVQRFSMLNTIREYGVERLAESGREPAVRRAHARHFSDLAADLGQALRGSDRDAALEELAASIGNLRTAWRFWFDSADLEQILRLIDALWALHDAKGWYHAAIELARDALSVLTAAATSSQHADDELALRTSLARALMAVQGYTPEVEQTFRDVLEISAAGAEAARRFPVMRALATYYMNTGRFESAARIGEELLVLADRENDQTMLMDGHYVFGAATAFTGDIETGMRHMDRAIDLFDPRAQPAGRFRLGPSQGVLARVASGLVLWQTGALETAVARLDEGVSLARRLDHPFSLAYALYHDGLLQTQRSRFEEGRERATELRQVADEHDYPVWRTLASVLEGVCLSGLGDTERGLALTEAGFELYRGLTTPPVFWPLILGLRSRVFALAGRAEEAYALIDEAMETVGRFESGAADILAPELGMLRGDILLTLPHPDATRAEDEYLAAIEGSRVGRRYMIELQARARLVKLRRAVGRMPDGSGELRALLASFTEGLDEHEVVMAASLLD